MNDKILGAIASALQIDAAELTTALKDGEAFLPDDQLAEKLKDVAAERLKAAKDAQHKRGQREIGDSIEKWAKAKGFSNEEKLKGTALLDAVFDTVDTKAPEGNDPTKFTKEELSKLPAVKEMLQSVKIEAVKPFEAKEAELVGQIKKERQERVSDVAKRFAAEIMEQEKVLLEVPEMGIVKKDRLEAVYARLNFSEIGLDDKGNPIVVDNDGAPATDDFGKPIPFKDRVIGIAKPMYGIRTQDPGKGGANPPTRTGGNGGGTDYVPKYQFATEADYERAITNTADNAERLEISRSYMHQKSAKAAGN